MNEAPEKSKTFSSWLGLTCLAGFGFGLFGEMEAFTGKNPAESRQWALIGFWFFMGGMILFGLVERIALGLVGGLQKAGGKPGPRLPMQRLNFFRYAGWFCGCLGLGLATSAIWRGTDLLWKSLEAIGPGIGLLLGLMFRQLLFLRKESN
jgi:hypothetical protein